MYNPFEIFPFLIWILCLDFFYRVFSDRLIDDADMETFVNILSDKLGTLFEQTFHNICPNKQPPIFGKYNTKFGKRNTVLIGNNI